MRFLSTIITVVTLVMCLTGAPLLGLHLSGSSVAEYLVFPPVTTCLTTDHAPFSWVAFFFLTLLIILAITPFLLKIYLSKGINREIAAGHYKFPAWGWIGLLIMITGWILAWTRFPFFSQLQTHTFTIPWIGYIISVNALTYKRSGFSIITNEPGYFACLFIFSALFWWYYEFLNQFVQNWYYVNVETLGQFEFFMYATLPFSTVLPAVISTFHLLRTFPRLFKGLDHFISIHLPNPRLLAIFACIAAVAGLSLTSVIPDHLFPVLWLAPLVILASAMVVSGVKTVFHGLSGGDWSTVYLLALSALLCGFLWEMWNYFSLTRWEYAVPFVGRFKIFEMPILGYAGYLPFGLQCGLMAWLVRHILNKFSGEVPPVN